MQRICGRNISVSEGVFGPNLLDLFHAFLRNT